VGNINPAVSALNINKVYETGDIKVEVLREISLNVAKGEFTAVSGPSGAGKTTLLNIIGAIDKPTSGDIVVFGKNLVSENEDSLASFRCSNIGFVFQSYNLISTLTVEENIAFPMEWLHEPEDKIKQKIDTLLEMFELGRRGDHFPFQLSGGEQQRVAFARALANDPPLLLLDEPTGNLDTKTGLKIVQILEKLKNDKKTIIAATHDERIINLAEQKLCLEDGKLTETDE